jgi:ribulose-phosphate 3-epimerase
MDNDYVISASILSADFKQLADQLAETEAAGADWFHIDVMDGQFVPNLSMGPFIVAACREATSLPLDVHLMINNPENLLEAFAKAGADRLTVHVEAVEDLEKTLLTIREMGLRASIALSPDSPVEAIEPALFMVDMVLVMTVHPGYSGQEFLPEMLPKIHQVRMLLDEVNPHATIQVDGGINARTLPLTLGAGAQVFVAASAIYGHPQGIQAGLKELREQLD